MNKVSITALHGFMGGDKSACDALSLDGDNHSITLTKGPALPGWLTDTTKIVCDDGTMTTVKDENIRRMTKLVMQWIKGEELDA